MFFHGDLQAGIAKALQEQRLVGCFVSDESALSERWEKSWLADAELQSLLESRVVLLRLVSGSQEAAFLAAFCPVPSVPCLLFINNGQVQYKLTADLSEEDFKSGLRDAIAGWTSGAAAPSSPSPDQPAAAAAASSPGLNSRVQSVLDERRVRLDEDKASKDAAEAAHRKARAEARRLEASGEGSGPGSRRGSQSAHAHEVKKARAEAKAERERILRRIEDDKAARRETEAHRRKASKTEAEIRTSTDLQRPGSNGSGSPTGAIRECALQVRLLDGRSIRKRFSTWKTLRTHVRPWIDGERSDGGDAPYTLRQVLAPMPNRVIEIGEEDEDLENLGLFPSATLVMVAVKGYSEAYSGNGGTAAKGVTGIVSGGVGMIGNALSGFFSRSPPSSPPSGRGRFELGGETAMEGEEEREDQHLYAGGGLNVEPRSRELKREDSWG